METIKNYVLMLAAYIFISSVIHGLLPESSMKKTVKSVLGIIFAVLVISPVLKVNSEKLDIFQEVNEYTIDNSNIDKMNELKEDQMQRMIKQQLKTEIEQRLSQYGVKGCVEVVLNEKNSLSEIVINKDILATEAEIAIILGTAEESIKIRRQE